MKSVQRHVSRTPKNTESTRARPSQQPTFVAGSPLTQLATMMNSSSRVQALAELRDGIEQGLQKPSLTSVASGNRQVEPEQLPSLPVNRNAGLEQNTDSKTERVLTLQRQKATAEEIGNPGQEETQDSVLEEAISELLCYATESELDAMLGNKFEEDTLPDSQSEATAQTIQSPFQMVKARPKNRRGYATTAHAGRTYYHRHDAASNRTIKFAGPIIYTQCGRIATPKVSYKRKADHAGHLIAHSFGGPPRFAGNFVAMNKLVNSAGGDWGEMEAYIRKRLKARNTAAYMSVSPQYSDPKTKRPTSIVVTVHFNRDPKKKRFTILTP
jgi:hypothetical protein